MGSGETRALLIKGFEDGLMGAFIQKKPGLKKGLEVPELVFLSMQCNGDDLAVSNPLELLNRGGDVVVGHLQCCSRCPGEVLHQIEGS